MDDDGGGEAADQHVYTSAGSSPGRRGSAMMSRASTKRVSFVAGASVAEPPTRQQLVRYVSLQHWSRWGLLNMPVPVTIWFIIVSLLLVASHTQTSFFVQDALVGYFKNITADLSRGVPPDRVFSEALSQDLDGVSCTCACALQRNQALCEPSTSNRTENFETSVKLTQLSLLRHRSEWIMNNESGRDRPVGWDDLRTLADVWFWLQHGLVPEIWKQEPLFKPVHWRNFHPQASENATNSSAYHGRGILLRWNQMIGGLRMRQFRLKEDFCSIDHRITDRYAKTCHSKEPADEPYGPGVQSYAEGFMPEPNVLGAFDAHLDLAYPTYVATEKLEHVLNAHGWLDPSTDALHVQAAFVNAESDPPLLGRFQLSFGFERSGGLRHSIRVHTVSTVPFNTDLEWWLTVIWLLLVIFLVVRQVYRGISACKKHHLNSVFCNFWNIADLATLVYSFGLAANYSLLSAETAFTVQQVADLPAAPDLDIATTDVLRIYHETWDSALDRVLILADWGEWNRILLFYYTLLLTLQFLQLFRAQPKLAELGRVLINSIEDLIHYTVLFLILFMNFAFSGFMLYGLYLEGWSTGTQAINTSLQILMGLCDIVEMYEIAPISTLLWFTTFLGAMIFVMLNLLLAIAIDNFGIVKARAGTKVGVWTQFKFLVGDQWQRGLCKGLCCCCPCRRCRRDPAKPPHSLMLREIMHRCGYSSKERRRIQHNVLGPQWVRKAIEKETFACEKKGVESVLDIRQAYADSDLREMGVDEDYIDDLCKSTKDFLKHEYDLDEAREAQLREIVLLAQSDMTDMRARLADCQEFAGVHMANLAQRLESLETVIHHALQELVHLAEGANISTKGQVLRSPAARAQMDGTMSTLRSISPKKKTQSMFSSSWKGVLEDLKDDPEDVDGAGGRGRSRGSVRGSVRGSMRGSVRFGGGAGGGAPGSSSGADPEGTIDDWQRAHKRVSVTGKRITKSARDEWRGK
mmetsp:Transcript_31841/g.83793  ORF Transcript_31841/g.83793 Transcript_31841/m.83793 type:complete len:975 (-) Transcript_31841:19-2943(-)